jgi:hypothetical protein
MTFILTDPMRAAVGPPSGHDHLCVKDPSLPIKPLNRSQQGIRVVWLLLRAFDAPIVFADFLKPRPWFPRGTQEKTS